MNIAKPEAGYSSFLDRLRLASSRVLLLDYDGTLAPFQVDPVHAFPYPAVPGLLKRIMRTGTRVVLISGRSAEHLLPLIKLNPVPEIWGCHGLERLMPDGSYQPGYLTELQIEGINLATTAVPSALRRVMEMKRGGVALHWRGLPSSEAESLRNFARLHWNPLLEKHELRLLQFDGGIEICSGTNSKGQVVKIILGESPKDSAVAYLGDDVTDEDAFGALKGKGLSILVRPVSRPTAADLWLQPPEQLTEFLESWMQACGEEK